MKRLTVLIMLVILSITGYSQVNGVNLSDAVSTKEGIIAYKLNQESFFIVDSGQHYIISYPINPMGLKGCVEEMVYLAYANGKSFSAPDNKSEIIAMYVASINDYVQLHQSLLNGDSDIKRIWVLQNRWLIGFTLIKNFYIIHLIKLDNERSNKEIMDQA